MDHRTSANRPALGLALSGGGFRGMAHIDHLPRTFSELAIPLSVVVTALPSKRMFVFDSGELAPAIAASCAMPWLFRRVEIGGQMYTDGGWACVLPAVVCRARGCTMVIGSDVWWRASMVRKVGCRTDARFAEPLYSRQYMEAVRASDMVVHPKIPALGAVPGSLGMRALIRSGEVAAEKCFGRISCSI